MKNPAADRKKQDLIRLVRQAGILTSIPMVLVGGPTLGFLIGRFLDRRFSSDPWGVFGAVIVGMVAGLAETVRLIQKSQNVQDASQDGSS